MTELTIGSFTVKRPDLWDWDKKRFYIEGKLKFRLCKKSYLA